MLHTFAYGKMRIMEEKEESAGAALVRKRWEKTTPEERKEISRRLHEAKAKKKAKKAKKQAKKLSTD